MEAVAARAFLPLGSPLCTTGKTGNAAPFSCKEVAEKLAPRARAAIFGGGESEMDIFKNSLGRSVCIVTWPKVHVLSGGQIFRAVKIFRGQCPLSFSARAKKRTVATYANTKSASNDALENIDDAGTSFLHMWDRAKAARTEGDDDRSNLTTDAEDEDWTRRSQEFEKILEVPSAERNQIQKQQVIDRAAAALARANAFLAQNPGTPLESVPGWKAQSLLKPASGSTTVLISSREVRSQLLSSSTPTTGKVGEIPGPDFWSWVPEPLDAKKKLPSESPGSKFLSEPRLQESGKSQNDAKTLPWDEPDRIDEELPLIFQSRATPSLPPFQSLVEFEKEKLDETEQELAPQPDLRMPEPDTQIASAVYKKQRNRDSPSSKGMNEDGSRWWRETGVEVRGNGVVCNWTVIRGVSADGGTEWEEKFWEASDAFDYKELGAEKSGRDAFGSVWHEFWKESMWQDVNNGLQHIEKTADKWAQDAKGGQWHEKWFEHYDASGRADKWADKWSQIDPNTHVEAGHAHCWHERWGETYDGEGGTMKYTDKWAERREEDGGWTKWGDKWDEHFDRYGHGVKQGETWWQGTSGDRWNRTWGERHNQTGWVHKYGKSSSGEHWDTHQQQDTWYQGKPHFGFRECFDQSVVLRRVSARGKKRL